MAIPIAIGGQDRTQFKMPCAQVLQLGLDKFMDAYGEQTQDYSTYGQKQAFGYYVDCKRPANDKHAAQLPASARHQVDQIRRSLQEIGDASWSNEYINAGGGTMYSLASVGAYAVREDFISTLITAMLKPRKEPLARRRANAALREARRLVPLNSQPDLEYWDAGDRPEQLKRYRANVSAITNALAIINRLVPLLSDSAAELTARRAADELDTGME